MYQMETNDRIMNALEIFVTKTAKLLILTRCISNIMSFFFIVGDIFNYFVASIAILYTVILYHKIRSYIHIHEIIINQSRF